MRIPLLFIGCLAISAVACESGGQSTTSGSGGRGGRGSSAAIAVETTTVQRMSVHRQVELSGTLLSPDQAKVSSEVAGIVRDVPVELGTEVQVGQPLVHLVPRELELALERAESSLRQTEAQLGIDRANKEPPPDEAIASVKQAVANRDDAHATFTRAESLNTRGMLSQADRDSAETRLKVADANYQAALDNVHSLKASLQDRRAALDLAQKKLADAVIKAPVAGSVSERLVQPGEFIKEQTPVVTIVQMSPLKLKTAIQEKNAGLIKPGQPVTFSVQAFPDRSFSGKIAFVSPSVDQTTRTFAVEAIVENDKRELKPGFFVQGRVETRMDQDVLAVPEDAVSSLAGVSTVYAIEQGKARQQRVTLGQHEGKLVEIVDGLKGDETLATTNLGQLATGVSVKAPGAAGEAAAADKGAGKTGRGGRGRSNEGGQ